MTVDSLGRVNQSDDLISDYWTGKLKDKEEILKPTEFFKRYCAAEPWMPECKEYDV